MQDAGTSRTDPTPAGWAVRIPVRGVNGLFRTLPRPDAAAITGGHLMGIGASIFLMALGAILTFATNVSISGLDLDVVGIVLMLAGAFGLIMTMFVWGPRRRAGVIATDEEIIEPTRRTRVYRPAEEVVEERRIYDDGRPL